MPSVSGDDFEAFLRRTAEEIIDVAVREIISEVPSLRGRGLGCNYVIYFFVASREVYLHGVINLYFVCNKLCNFLAFILRLCTNVYCEAPPSLCAGEVTNTVWFVHHHRRRACICFAKRHPPFARLVGMMTVKWVLAPLASYFNYARLAFGFARKDFHSVLRLFCRGGRAVPSAVARHDFPP